MRISSLDPRLTKELEYIRGEMWSLRTDCRDAAQAINIGMLTSEETAIARSEIMSHSARIDLLKRLMLELVEQVFEHRIIFN